jgi:Tfp pilus assembly protein PilX
MKPKQLNQNGFIPLLVTVLLVVVALIYLAYTRVLQTAAK